MDCRSANERADTIIKFVDQEMVRQVYLLNDLLKISVIGGGGRRAANR